MSIIRIVPLDPVQTQWSKKKIIKEVQWRKMKSTEEVLCVTKRLRGSLYIPERLRGINICDWNGHKPVPPMSGMTIQSYNRTGGITNRYIYIYIYGFKLCDI